MSVESSERLKQENRKKILCATKELLATKSVQETTLNEIAARAKVTKRTVTNIFGTKNNLILQAIISCFGAYRAKYFELIATDEFREKSGLDQVMYLELERCRGLYENPQIARLVKEVEAMCIKEDFERESFREYLRVSGKMVDFFCEPLQKGYRDGSIRQKLDRDDVEAFLFFAFGVTIQRLSILDSNPGTRDSIDLKKLMRHILESTRRYLAGGA